MQSRRDQVQAHLFVMSRLSSGMLRAEPDAPDTPHGRTTRGTLTGVILGGLAAVGMTVYGLISPGGSTGWAKDGTLVVVKETGARYLYLGSELHPVLNIASARLVAGAQLTVDQVSQNSLSGAQVGAPLGIVGAPDTLPDGAALADGTWLACGTQPTGGGAAELTLALAPRSRGTSLTAGQGTLVSAPDGSVYLLWQGQRMQVAAGEGVLQALGYGTAVPFPVTESFLDALPAGPVLAAPDIPDRGKAGPRLANNPTRIGQLFALPGGQRYVLTKAGLVPIDAMLYKLLSGDPRTQSQAYRGAAVTTVLIGAEDLAALSAQGAAPTSTLPADAPQLVTVGQGQGVCAESRLGSGAPAVALTVVSAAAVAGQAPTAQPGVVPGCAAADLVAVPAQGGTLVRALSGAGVGTTEYLVTDAGVKYPLASADATTALGYSGVAALAAPGALLALLPTGPSLDPAELAAGGVVEPAPAAGACTS